MCGIVGFTGEGHQAAPILLDGLSKLGTGDMIQRDYGYSRRKNLLRL